VELCSRWIWWSHGGVFMMGEGCLWLFMAERENFGVQILTDLRGESEMKKKKNTNLRTKSKQIWWFWTLTSSSRNIFGQSQNKSV
jgi:hypothetical protein